MRTLQEWLGHRDFKTTLICADYAPSAHERALVELAFGPRGINRGINLSETGIRRMTVSPMTQAIPGYATPIAQVVVQVVAGSSPVAHPLVVNGTFGVRRRSRS